MITNMTNIQWLEGEIPKPGVCASCGSADHAGRKFVTISKFIKNYGKVLLCGECVNAVLQLPGLDFVPRIDLEMAKTEAKVYRDRVEPTFAVLRSVRDFCNEHLNADGSPKAEKVKLLTDGRADSAKSPRAKTVDLISSSRFVDKGPDDAA